MANWLMQVLGKGREKRLRRGDEMESASIITKEMTYIGTIIGNDSVRVDGVVEGDIKVNGVVFVTFSGEVRGNIKAKQVVCDGRIKGGVKADNFEILTNGSCDGDVQVNKILIKGEIKGNLIGGGLFIDTGGEAVVSAQVKKVVAGGLLEGNVACKELKTLPTSILRGQIFADEIENEGGKIECYIGRYSDLAKQSKVAAYYLNLFESRSDYILLEDKEIDVDIESEIKESKRGKDTNEE